MSIDTNKNYAYYINGRNIELYQVNVTGKTTSVGGYKVRMPDSLDRKALEYPDEDIALGLMYEGTQFVEPFVTTDPNDLTNASANPGLSEDTSPDEESHVNMNRMLSMAIVEYIKAMESDSRGDLERKEYYMREFWSKVADSESNKRTITISSVSPPYAVI